MRPERWRRGPGSPVRARAQARAPVSTRRCSPWAPEAPRAHDFAGGVKRPPEEKKGGGLGRHRRIAGDGKGGQTSTRNVAAVLGFAGGDHPLWCSRDLLRRRRGEGIGTAGVQGKKLGISISFLYARENIFRVFSLTLFPPRSCFWPFLKPPRFSLIFENARNIVLILC
jgi:hypothetical protein